MQAGHTEVGHTGGTLRPRIANGKNSTEKDNGYDFGSRKCKTKELAQHTLVHRESRCREVTMTIVMNAVGALLLHCRRLDIMHVKRSKEQHWQIDGQQHPQRNTLFCL